MINFAANQILLVSSVNLPPMVRQALLKDGDGAYCNVVVAAHCLNNVRAKPGELVFDPTCRTRAIPLTCPASIIPS